MLVSGKLLVVLALAIAFFNTGIGIDTSEHRDPVFCYQFIDVHVVTDNRYTVNDHVLELKDSKEKKDYLIQCPEKKDHIGINYAQTYRQSACYMITYNDNAENGKLKAMAGCLRDYDWLKHDKADKIFDKENADRFSDPECALHGNLKQTDRYYFVNEFIETKRLELCNQNSNWTHEQVEECEKAKGKFTIQKACYSTNYENLPLKGTSDQLQYQKKCKQYRVDDVDYKEVQLDTSLIALGSLPPCNANEWENPYKNSTPHCYYMAFGTENGNGNSLSFSGGCVREENECVSKGLAHKECTNEPETIKSFFPGSWEEDRIPVMFCCCKGEMCNEHLVAQVPSQHISCHEYPLINIDIPEEVDVANKRTKCIGEYCVQISMKDDQGHHYAMASCLTKNDYLVIKKDMLDLKTKEEDPHTKCTKNKKSGKNAQIISDFFEVLNRDTNLEFKEACFSTTQNSNAAKHHICYKYNNLLNNGDNIKSLITNSATCLSTSKDNEDSCFFAYYENADTNIISVSGGCVMHKNVCDKNKWTKRQKREADDKHEGEKEDMEPDNPVYIDNCITGSIEAIKEVYKEMGYKDLRENQLPVVFCCCSGPLCNDMPATSTTTMEPTTAGAATSTISLVLLAIATLLAGLRVYRLAMGI